MPSGYAHFRMGEEVREHVCREAKEIIRENRELYRIGLHGPDILFYYNAIFKNKVNRTGFGMHDWAGKEVFARAAQVVREQSGESERRACLAYVYGFICHFAMDVTCHGYIGEKMEETGLSHAELEAEFDRELMVMDGYNPVTKSLTEHIIPSVYNAEVIQKFFKHISAEEVEKALQGMITYLGILTTDSKLRRGLICLFLRIFGKYKEMKGLMINFESNPACVESTAHLIELYDEAKELAIRLIGEFDAYLTGISPLDEKYNYTFGSVLKKEDQA